jgi:hypothetical protein
VLPGHPVHAFNISYPAPAEAAGSAPPERRYASLLLRTAARDVFARLLDGVDPGLVDSHSSPSEALTRSHSD